MPLTKGTTPFKPFLKRKPTNKSDLPVKKPKEVVGEKPVDIQMPSPPPRPGAGKGLMTTPGPILKKHPPLLHEDSCRVVGLLLSIIKTDDNKDR